MKQALLRPGHRATALGASLVALVFSGNTLANWAINLQTPNSSTAQQMYDLHTLITLICGVIFCIVFGVMFYSLYAHRKSKGHKAATFHESTAVEVAWTVVPFLILLGMAFPVTKAVLDIRDSSAAGMTIKVTGYQWKWGYDYINEGFGFVSTLSTPLAQIMGSEPKGENYLLEVDNPLVVPVGTKVRLLVTANDVLHAWWVPALGVKQDAIPGFVRDAWFRADRPGIYRGNCAELCGKEHGYMPVVVEVKTKADYEKWLAAEKEKRGLVKTAAAPAPSTDGLPAKIFFAVGAKDLPSDAQASLDAALTFLKAKPDAKVDITGYTDKTGNRDANLELAKERAKAVREALMAAGIPKERINMKPPAEITGGNDDKEARRVEINPGS